MSHFHWRVSTSYYCLSNADIWSNRHLVTTICFWGDSVPALISSFSTLFLSIKVLSASADSHQLDGPSSLHFGQIQKCLGITLNISSPPCSNRWYQFFLRPADSLQYYCQVFHSKLLMLCHISVQIFCPPAPMRMLTMFARSCICPTILWQTIPAICFSPFSNSLLNVSNIGNFITMLWQFFFFFLQFFIFETACLPVAIISIYLLLNWPTNQLVSSVHFF